MFMHSDKKKMIESRPDDFETRREHLNDLSEAELKERFWELTEEIVRPLVDLAHEHTSPSIERSVLLRMGFSSEEARVIVEGVLDRGLLGKGAGHVVYRLAGARDLDVREAGLALMEGKYWEDVMTFFSPGGDRA